MNNQKKVFYRIVRYLTLVSEFCDCYWNKGHIPPVGMAFEMDNSMCCSSLCHKEHFKNRNIIKQHIRFLAVTAVLE
jgi:hypothetical protein